MTDQETRSIDGWVRHCSAPGAAERIAELADEQACFVESVMRESNDGRTASTREFYLTCLRRLLDRAECQIVGAPLPETAGTVILAVCPHLGFSKLMKRRFMERVGPWASAIRHAVPNGEPWLWRHLAAAAIAAETGREFIPVEMRYGWPVGNMQIGYGAAFVDGQGEGVERLVRIVRSLLLPGRENLVGLFPEGGTTGKRHGRGQPFQLGPFRTGFSVLGALLDAPIFTIGHYVDRTGRSHVEVLGELRGSTTNADSLARSAQADLQGGIDHLRCHVEGR